jgi:hypothetical protein
MRWDGRAVQFKINDKDLVFFAASVGGYAGTAVRIHAGFSTVVCSTLRATFAISSSSPQAELAQHMEAGNIAGVRCIRTNVPSLVDALKRSNHIRSHFSKLFGGPLSTLGGPRTLSFEDASFLIKRAPDTCRVSLEGLSYDLYRMPSAVSNYARDFECLVNDITKEIVLLSKEATDSERDNV